MYVICAISDSNKHFQTPIDEYLKRLGKSIDLVDLKPTKHWSRQQIITQETEKILTKITKLKSKWYRIVLLIKEGDQLTTEQCHTSRKHKNVCFVIGWPYGVDESLLAGVVDDRISFGAQTMPHGLAKLVLIEQIYRVQMIEQGRQYHY